MKIQVNTHATVQNFGSVMTDKTKLLSELLQNSRRAGASLIEFTATANQDGTVDVTVADNGVGITDFTKLFTLSESGWNEHLASTEGSFGVGFFSVFYAANEVLVQSKGQSILIDCALALSMADFGEPIDDHSCTDFTKITLRGVKMSIDVIARKLRELTEYSRVPVTFNGDMLERKLCYDVLLPQAKELIATPFGQLVVLNEWSDSFKVIVQDLFVGDEYNYQRLYNYLFSDTLPCRMPDRDMLIDESVVLGKIRQCVREHWKAKLQAIRVEMNDDVAYLDRYFNEVLRYDPSALLEIDYLPAAAFLSNLYPCQRDDYDSDEYVHTTGLHRGVPYVGFKERVELWEAPVAANFAFIAKARIPHYNLPSEHWFFSDCIEAKEEAFVVECMGGELFDFTLDYYGNGNALVAKAVKIIHQPTGHEAVLNNDGFAVDIESCFSGDRNKATIMLDDAKIDAPSLILQTHGEFYWGSDLFLQLCSYVNGSEEYQDIALEDDIASFERQFITVIRGNVEDALSALLGKLPPVLAAKLNGKELSVSIRDGRASFALKAA